jgi:coproporphyrinogen III oxidase
MPPMAEWTCNFKTEEGSEEEETLRFLSTSVDWIKK